MKNIAVLLLILFIASSCELVDPTEVENPNVTEEDFLKSPDAMVIWSRGVERQLSATLSEIILDAILISDSYYNNRTLYSKVFDIPQILSSDTDVSSLQSDIAILRANAEFGLEKVAEADAETTQDQIAEMHFYRGIALLFSGEYFTGLPSTGGGVPKSSEELINEAITEFENALSKTTNNTSKAEYHLILARAYHRIGDKTNAVSYADQAIALDPDLLRYAYYDEETSNGVQVALYSGQDEFEPLPRLDFLDPKYYSNSSTDESSIPIIKIEEAYLIKAEAELANGSLESAKNILSSLIDVVDSRPVESVDETSEERGAGRDYEYPNNDTIKVRASEDDEFRTGLVRTRGEGSDPVSVPVVSGTSVSKEMIQELSDISDALETLYLMRQEIFIAEGRRMVDLGIKWPLADDEANNNPNASGSEYLQAQIPSFIPLNTEMDRFDWDKETGEVTINHNMNKILVENAGSDYVLPFN
ncbi:MAG: hypothetical protein PVH88_13845 [Ignavibacteria bacterium]|jgi:tetratricopeptide (TPR) repeat protein